MRCVFAKEFEFEEVLNIWDWVLMGKSKNGLERLEFVALAMIVWTRDACMSYLVRGDRYEILQRMNRVQFKGKGNIILQLAKSCYDYITGKLHEKIYFPFLNADGE